MYNSSNLFIGYTSLKYSLMLKKYYKNIIKNINIKLKMLEKMQLIDID